jgi:regulatory protein YycH of two-component signal transduction system YycFG
MATKQYTGSIEFTAGSGYNAYAWIITDVGGYQSASTFDVGTEQGIIDAISDLETAVAYSLGATVTTAGSIITASFDFTIDTATQQTPYSISFFNNADGSGYSLQLIATDAQVTACPDCLEKTLSACEASYTITAGLTADTDYTVVLTDRNEIRYTQLVTSDGDGDLTIDTTDFPTGAFTPEFGGFTMVVYSDVELTTPVEITSRAHTYGCVQLFFQYTVTTTSYLNSFLVTDQLDFFVTDAGDTFICN